MFDPLAEQLSRCSDAQSIIQCVLHQGLDLSRASVGNVQLMNWSAGCLEIKAQRGFNDEFLNFFRTVYIEDSSACARALQKRQSVIIRDVIADGQFASCLHILDRAGVRAVQSTPMISSSGAFMGVLSTHFPAPHQPDEREMRGVQHLAQAAANALIRQRAASVSAHEQIAASLSRLSLSYDAMERAEELLPRTPGQNGDAARYAALASSARARLADGLHNKAPNETLGRPSVLEPISRPRLPPGESTAP